MVQSWLLGTCLLAMAPAVDPTPAPDDRAAYEQARSEAGRDPNAHVRLALWCEQRGLDAERLRHLTLAVLTDPDHAAARGLMGFVADAGRWMSPSAVAERQKADADRSRKRADYEGRRQRAADSADDQWRLALWCEQNGLEAEAHAHLAAVVRLDPGREAAWKRLGCKKHNGRWMTPAQIEAEKAEAQAQREADLRWRPRLAEWRGWLRDPGRRDEAREALAAVEDPRAVPAIWNSLAKGGQDDQLLTVQLLGQIAAPDASRALAILGAVSASAEVRRTATETLKHRDPREFVGLLIGLLRDPIRYEVRPVGGPGSPGALLVEGERFNVQRLYSPPAVPSLPAATPTGMTYDAYGLPVLSYFGGLSWGSTPINDTYIDQLRSQRGDPQRFANLNQQLGEQGGATGRAIAEALSGAVGPGLAEQQAAIDSLAGRRGETLYVTRSNQVQVPVGQMLLEAQRSAAVAQQQLAMDAALIDRHNAMLHESNGRVLPILQMVTGQDLMEDRNAWQAWWVNNQGYSRRPSATSRRPTIVENVPLNYLPRPVASFTQPGPIVDVQIIHSCFAAGTPVVTAEEAKAIEEIRVGDRVLAQSTSTGALSYQPVVAIYHNDPSPTLRLRMEGEGTVIATGIHRFWKAGEGWVMARDLKPGDALRTVGGTDRIASIEAGEVQPVFNLEVASGSSFFVGSSAILVHDNSLVQSESAPFDLAPDLIASADE